MQTHKPWIRVVALVVVETFFFTTLGIDFAFATPSPRSSLLRTPSVRDGNDVQNLRDALQEKPKSARDGAGRKLERHIVSKEIAGRYVAPEILLLFEVAERLGLHIKITGGTARDFALAALTQRALPLPKITDYDVAIPFEGEPPSPGSLNEKAYELFTQELERTFRERYPSRKMPKVDYVPGVYTDEYVYETLRDIEPTPERPEIGAAFSISKLAVSKEGDSFVIEDAVDAIKDIQTRTLRVIVTPESLIPSDMLGKTLGKWSIYRKLDFDFYGASRVLVFESLKALGEGSEVDRALFLEVLVQNTENVTDLLTIADTFHLGQVFRETPEELGLRLRGAFPDEAQDGAEKKSATDTPQATATAPSHWNKLLMPAYWILVPTGVVAIWSAVGWGAGLFTLLTALGFRYAFPSAASRKEPLPPAGGMTRREFLMESGTLAILMGAFFLNVSRWMWLTVTPFTEYGEVPKTPRVKQIVSEEVKFLGERYLSDLNPSILTELQNRIRFRPLVAFRSPFEETRWWLRGLGVLFIASLLKASEDLRAIESRTAEGVDEAEVAIRKRAAENRISRRLLLQVPIFGIAAAVIATDTFWQRILGLASWNLVINPELVQGAGREPTLRMVVSHELAHMLGFMGRFPRHSLLADAVATLRILQLGQEKLLEEAHRQMAPGIAPEKSEGFPRPRYAALGEQLFREVTDPEEREHRLITQLVKDGFLGSEKDFDPEIRGDGAYPWAYLYGTAQGAMAYQLGLQTGNPHHAWDYLTLRAWGISAGDAEQAVHQGQTEKRLTGLVARRREEFLREVQKNPFRSVWDRFVEDYGVWGATSMVTLLPLFLFLLPYMRRENALTQLHREIEASQYLTGNIKMEILKGLQLRQSSRRVNRDLRLSSVRHLAGLTEPPMKTRLRWLKLLRRGGVGGKALQKELRQLERHLKAPQSDTKPPVAQDGGTRFFGMTKPQFYLEYRVQGYVRPGFMGANRKQITAKLNEWFGEKGWEIQYRVGDEFVSEEKAIELYEEAYYEYFRNHPDTLEALLEVARDVWDTAESNIRSGTDYAIQETLGRHLHDIAIRRVVQRLGKKFRGNRLVRIRGPKSEGFLLGPGKIPFHKPELILKPPLKGWWDPGSIEDFFQSNRAIILTPGYPAEILFSEEGDEVILSFAKLLPFLSHKEHEILTLEDLDRLFWVYTPEEFPLDPEGRPRKFTWEEMKWQMGGMLQLFPDLEFVRKGLRKTSRDAQKWYRSFLGHPQEKSVEGRRDREIVESYARLSSFLLGVIRDRNAIPIFLARDALMFHEFSRYVSLLEGETHQAHLFYQAGSPTRHGISKRDHDETMDYILWKVTEAVNEIRDQLIIEGMITPEVMQGIRKDPEIYFELQKRFAERFEDLLRTDRIFQAHSERVYRQFKAMNIPQEKPVVIVDSNATGKTAFYFKTVIDYFSKKEGEPYEVTILLGWARDKALGMPELGNFTSKVDPEVEVFHDVHWPFYFHKFDEEGRPTFKVQTNIAKLILLTYQSMLLYNSAIDYVAQKQNRAQDGGPRSVNAEWPELPFDLKRLETRDPEIKIAELGAIQEGLTRHPSIPREGVIDRLLEEYSKAQGAVLKSHLLSVLIHLGIRHPEVQELFEKELREKATHQDYTAHLLLQESLMAYAGTIRRGETTSTAPEMVKIFKDLLSHPDEEVSYAALYVLVSAFRGAPPHGPILKAEELMEDPLFIERLRYLVTSRQISTAYLSEELMEQLGLSPRTQDPAVGQYVEWLERHALQKRESNPDLNEEELGTLYALIQENGKSPRQFLGDLFRGGKKVVFISDVTHTGHSLPFLAEEILALKEEVGLNRVALPFPKSEEENLQKFVRGEIGLAAWEYGKRAFLATPDDSEGVIYASSFRQMMRYLNGKVRFIFYGKGMEEEGEFAVLTQLKPIQEALHELADPRILVLGIPLMGAQLARKHLTTRQEWVTLSIVHELEEEIGEERIASFLQADEEKWFWDHFGDVHNLVELIERFPITESFAIDMQPPLSHLQFSRVYQQPFSAAWDGILFWKTGSQYAAGGEETIWHTQKLSPETGIQSTVVPLWGGRGWIEAGKYVYRIWVDEEGVYFQRHRRPRYTPRGEVHPIGFNHLLTVGRSSPDYSIDDPYLAELHFTIIVVKDKHGRLGLMIEDKKTQTGTKVAWLEAPAARDGSNQTQRALPSIRKALVDLLQSQI